MGGTSTRQDELRRARHAKPFVPFTVVMKTGDRYPIEDRFHIGFSGNRMMILRPTGSVELTVDGIAAIETGVVSA